MTTRRRRQIISVLVLLAVVLVGVGVALVLPFWRLSGQFADHRSLQPSRLYGASSVLSVGDRYPADAVIEEIAGEGYRKSDQAVPGRGRYRETDGGLTVHLRPFETPEGRDLGGLVELTYRGDRIRRITVDDRPVEAVRLPPPLLAAYYGDDLEERRPLDVDELPQEVVEAVLAAEDRSFFDHSGLSLTGILRAAWVNVRGGEIRQGGSTLTQQLVKNLYLTHERTLARKVQEAVLAVLVELRYGKREILRAYLNEIYLGSSNGVNVIGLGAASRVYFSKEPSELTLLEAATLAGMIRAPGANSPTASMENARERRDWVLGRMAELGWLEEERAAALTERPVVVSPWPVERRRAPYFAHAAAEEAARRFGVEELEKTGHVLFSTVRWPDQQAAQEAVGWGVDALETGWEKGAKVEGPLQAALVSVDPKTGGILAYVGGRDYGQSQYDRAGQARRQAGSAFKPVVYATAFEQGVAMPSSFVEDAPLTVRLAGQRWSPQNHDGGYMGWISARTALEQSLNTATARLALEVGLPPIVATARRLGVSAPLDEVPSLALGAFEVSPLELATVYATLANEGVRPPVHGLEAVVDAHGQPLEARPLPLPERALSPQTAYLVTSVLQGVVDRGTGAGVRRQGLHDTLAGKTGTSNERRDNWFAGYAPSRATVVWVGYDDNSPTRMSGSRAGVPIWARFMGRVRPAGGYGTFEQPPGVVTAVIDPQSGELATERCPRVITEVFLEGHTPHRVCHLHDGWFADSWDGDRGYDYEAGGEPTGERRHPFRRWLKEVFGDGR